MRLKSIGVLRGYAMGKTQLSKIADNIEREVDEALESERSENAKLLEIIADLEKMLPESERLHIHETANAIADDNAKLRELVRELWEDACQFDGFWDYVNDDGEIYSEDELPHYQKRMRELGIEVD